MPTQAESYHFRFWFLPNGGEWRQIDQEITYDEAVELMKDAEKGIVKYLPGSGHVEHVFLMEEPVDANPV